MTNTEPVMSSPTGLEVTIERKTTVAVCAVAELER